MELCREFIKTQAVGTATKLSGQTWRGLKRQIAFFYGLIDLKKNSLAMQLFKSSFLLFVTFDILLWERYLFEAKLWFCHSQVVSQLP